MRLARVLVALSLVTLLSRPAMAEPRWLACKFNDSSGKAQNFVMVFDDLRGTASLLDAGSLVEGANTSINFQSLRTRFPQFTITYNRNDGALAVVPSGGLGGILNGECRRSAAPPGAPQVPQ